MYLKLNFCGVIHQQNYCKTREGASREDLTARYKRIHDLIPTGT